MMKFEPKKIMSSRLSLGLFAALGLGIATLYGNEIRHEFNNVANAGTPLEQRQLITYEGPQKYGAIISGRSIVDNGRVPSYPLLSAESLRLGNKHADWNANDAFANAIRTVGDGIVKAVQDSPELAALMAKQTWTPQDCRQWDAAVIGFAGRQLDRVKGLQTYKYRTDGDVGAFRALVTGEERGMRATPNLNDLSSDIENGTYDKEYDCEGMSVVLTYLLQRTADRMLTPEQAPSYAYVHGSGSANMEEGSGVHAFILSRQGADIVSVIESTEYSMRTPAEGVFPLSRFAAGEMMLCDQDAVYGLDFTTDDVNALCIQKGITLHGERLERFRHQQQQELVPPELPGAYGRQLAAVAPAPAPY